MYTLYTYILQTYNVIHSRSFSQFSVKRYIQCCNFIQFTHFHVQDDLLRSLFKAARRLTLRPRWVRPQCNHQPPRLQWKLSCPTRRAPPQNQQILLPPRSQSLVCEVGSFWKSKCLHHWRVLPSFLGQLLWGLVWFFDQWIVAWFHECPYAVRVKKDLPLASRCWVLHDNGCNVQWTFDPGPYSHCRETQHQEIISKVQVFCVKWICGRGCMSLRVRSWRGHRDVNFKSSALRWSRYSRRWIGEQKKSVRLELEMKSA